MAKLTKKTGQRTSTQSALQKILCRENILAAVAVCGTLSAIFLYFSQKNHVVATISTEPAAVDGVGVKENLAIPLVLTVKNLGDGPITINDVFFAFPDPREKNGTYIPS